MHIATLFAYFVVGLPAIISAQETCPGSVGLSVFLTGIPSCSQIPNRGTRRGNNCQSRAGQMWAWHPRRRRCETLNYLGCGGNANRFCTREGCEVRCQPGRTTQRSTSRPITPATPIVNRPALIRMLMIPAML